MQTPLPCHASLSCRAACPCVSAVQLHADSSRGPHCSDRPGLVPSRPVPSRPVPSRLVSSRQIGDPSSQPNPQIGSVIVSGGCSTISHSHSTPILRSSSSTTLHQAAEHDSQLDDSQAEAVNIAAPPSRHASEQPHADLPGSQERVGRRLAPQSSTDSAHTFDDDAVGADCKQQ